MNGQTLQQTESLGSGAGNATEPTPIPLYTPTGWSTAAGYNYGTVVLPGIVNASGVGTGSGTTLYVYTDANGKASITVQDGNVPYYNAYGVSTSTATTTGGTVGLGISGTSLELGTGVSGVAGQVSYGQQVGALAQYGVSTASSTITTATPFAVTINAEDAAGNALTGDTSTVTLGSTGFTNKTSVAFYPSSADATAGTGAITTATLADGTATVYAVVTDATSTDTGTITATDSASGASSITGATGTLTL
ncbi:hypothetical protein NZD89_26970 [Alicyclobacillus fastidiosus]|uniref:Big-1 domain-containing protein n=1 Tax=Alicyclobacillus fastidiosus TaxID=392011 RepID=A0ABY6ZG35_9BACL|nr:hypothetical protein [Alicyclobacillus fastidiosus]WAH41802.1 hypothetical protein NZD89_26970 [Alicyclobacillus fastidiosus]GMA63500.1 hypothetical protein GCM10025859_39400 [Alicyclobacillus fastidiosus]